GKLPGPAPEASLDALAHALRADVVDHELEARLDARDAIAKVVRPGSRDCGEHLGGLRLRDEYTELARQPGHRREPTADANREALAPLVDDAYERAAVDL